MNDIDQRKIFWFYVVMEIRLAKTLNSIFFLFEYIDWTNEKRFLDLQRKL